MGAALGRGLRAVFGVGAVFVPLVFILWAVVLFGHQERTLGKRLTVLCAGLVVAVPFAAGVVWQYAFEAGRQALATANADAYPQAWLGYVGGFLAFELKLIGPVGEGLLALGAFRPSRWSPWGGILLAR